MYLVFDVGCIECCSDSGIVGIWDNEEDAVNLANRLQREHNFWDGGQHHFEVFKLPKTKNKIIRKFI